MPISPVEFLRQRNAAAGKPATVLTKNQAVSGTILTAVAAFGLIMADVYQHEGGYVNDKTDRGGETNHGVTIAVARQNGYLGAMKDFPRHCYNAGADVCADSIYRAKYIKAPGFEPMLAVEPAIADKLINTGINMGPSWPVTWFQAAIRVSGIPLAANAKMPATVAAYKTMQIKFGKVPACHIVLDAMVAGQLNRYEGIIRRNPSQVKYRNGWTKRAKAVRREWCGRGEAAA